MNKSLIWKICCLAAILVTAASFSSLVIPADRSTPFLLGMPYTLWMGFVVSAILLMLTIIGSVVHPAREEEND